MEKLESYVESKRIVRITNAKKKFKLLRDKVQYWFIEDHYFTTSSLASTFGAYSTFGGS